MKGIFVVIVPVFVLAGMLYYAEMMAPDDQKPYQLSGLAKIGNECEMISEKAALNLPEGLEFQRLEKTGRQTRVLSDCMSDRGYIENPSWALFAKLQAEQDAKVSKVSNDEAFEMLRKKYMRIYQAEKAEPLYWIAAKK